MKKTLFVFQLLSFLFWTMVSFSSGEIVWVVVWITWIFSYLPVQLIALFFMDEER